MPNVTTITAYNWTVTGYNATYSTSHQATITDDDGAYQGGSDTSEMISIDGGAPTASAGAAYAIDVPFTDVSGVSHVETFNFFLTGNAWYFAPGSGSAFSEGATLGSYQSHTVGWDYGAVACFANGTWIDTPGGRVAVEDLRPGDLVETGADGALPLRLNLSRVLEARERSAVRLAPVRIEPGALGPGQPRETLFVSRQHRMLVASPIVARMFGAPEVLVAAIRLTVLPGCTLERRHHVISYHHLVFDAHVIVRANGAPAESFLPAPVALGTLSAAARAEFEQLFGGLMPPCADPARPIPEHARQKQLIARHARNNRPLLSV
jgi:hypothetical protein